ncbi:MAG: InlB B-repeat-containing protein [Clostridia bacterium]|nr:InlB B-repeat-containing protein [Clostridia bacterium]
MKTARKSLLFMLASFVAVFAIAFGITLNVSTVAKADALDGGDFQVAIAVRVADASYSSGVRFKVRVSKTDFDETLKEEGKFKEGVKTGIIVTSNAIAKGLGSLTVEAAAENEHIYDVDTTNLWYTDEETDYYECAVAIYDISAEQSNVKLAVMPYATVGDTTVYRTTAGVASMADAVLAEPDEDIKATLAETYIHSYDIKYFDKSGNEIVAETTTADYGATLDQPETPVVTGYTFDGWTNSAGTAVWNFSNKVTGTVKLYAAYHATEYTATISRANGDSEEVTYTIENRAEILASISLTENGAQYTYAWDTALPATLPLEDCSFTEKRTVNNYTVHYQNASGVDVSTETVAYGSKPANYPWAALESTGDGTYIHNHSVSVSTDGENFASQGTIVAGGGNLSDFKAGLDEVHGDVWYKTEYANASPVIVETNGSFAAAYTDTTNKVFTFTNAASDGETVNRFQIHFDLLRYNFNSGNGYLALKVDAAGEDLAVETRFASTDGDPLYSVSGTGSVIVPVYYMENQAASEDRYWVDVYSSSATFTATVKFITGSESAINSVKTAYNTNFASFKGITLENLKTTTANLTSFNTAYTTAVANWWAKSYFDNYTEYKDGVDTVAASFTVVDDMTGANINNRVKVSGQKNGGFYNGESHPNPSAFKPMCLHEPYGYCSRVTMSGGTNLQIRYETSSLDLSEYSYVLIGIINESNSNGQVWKYTSSGKTLATIPNSGGFATICLTVAEFMNLDPDGTGCLYTDYGSSGSVWFTPIVAINSVAKVSSDIAAYLTAVGNDGVTLDENANFATWSSMINNIDAQLATLSDAEKSEMSILSAYNAKRFTVIDDMKGADIKSRVIVSGSGLANFHNGSTFSAIESMCQDHGDYGYCSRIVKTGGIIKLQYQTDGLDLSGYTHVIIGVINGDGSATSKWYKNDNGVVIKEIAAGEFATIKLTVDEFMRLDPESGNLFLCYYSGTPIWLTSIIAVAE